MGAQTRTDVLPYISLIPVFGYLWPGTSTILEYRHSGMKYDAASIAPAASSD